ncbi:MAG: hypothetical protein ACQJCO_07445 [cyanobacterium endosymbiont of Rhopalodia sterrenbergii]
MENHWGSLFHFVLEDWGNIQTHSIEVQGITFNIIDRGEITTLREIYHSTGAVSLTTMTVSSIPTQKFISLFDNDLVIDISSTQVIAKRLW